MLLLVPEEPDPFICLTEAIINHWPQYPYYGGEYEEIEPHITLAFGEESSHPVLAAVGADQTPVRARISSIGLSTGQPGFMTTRARFAFSRFAEYKIREYI